MKTFELGEILFVEIGNIIVPVGDIRYIQRSMSDSVMQRFQITLKSFGDEAPTFLEGVATVDSFDVENE